MEKLNNLPSLPGWNANKSNKKSSNKFIARTLAKKNEKNYGKSCVEDSRIIFWIKQTAFPLCLVEKHTNSVKKSSKKLKSKIFPKEEQKNGGKSYLESSRIFFWKN